MASYYVNHDKQPNGDHEVHKQDCLHMPDRVNIKYLGLFNSCAEALKEAKKTYQQSNGCFFCCRDSHTA